MEHRNFRSFNTVFFGKVGTEGQPSYRSFDTTEKCLKEAEKLVKEKLKKGYTEKPVTTDTVSSDQYYCTTCGFESPSIMNLCPSSRSNNSFVLPKKTHKISNKVTKEWEEIVNVKNLNKALTKHFSFLADMPGFGKVLDALIKQVKNAAIVKDKLVVKFNNSNEELIASGPADLSKYKMYPKSFQALVKNHEELYLKNAGLFLGNDGGFDGIESGADWQKLVSNPNEILVALTEGSDWWLYHPKEKNSVESPTLHFCSHEDASIRQDGESFKIGSFFIKKIIESLGLDISIPQKSPLQKPISKLKFQQGRTLPVSGRVFSLPDTNRLAIIEQAEKFIHLVDVDVLSLDPIEKIKTQPGNPTIQSDTDNIVVFAKKGLWIKCYKGNKFKTVALENKGSIEAGAVGSQKIIYQDKKWSDEAKAIHLNIIDVISGKKKTASPINGLVAIGVCNENIIAQTQRGFIILDLDGNILQKLKLNAAFPSIIPFKKLNLVVSLDSSDYCMVVADLSDDKTVKLKNVPFQDILIHVVILNQTIYYGWLLKMKKKKNINS